MTVFRITVSNTFNTRSQSGLAGRIRSSSSAAHRNRFEDTQNARGPNGESEPWREGENYTALKIAPKSVISQGIEYIEAAWIPDLLLQRFALLPVHRRVERARPRRATARRPPVRERRVPRVPGVRRGTRGADISFLSRRSARERGGVPPSTVTTQPVVAGVREIGERVGDVVAR